MKYFKDNETLIEETKYYNHKIVDITIEYGENIPVYDMYVPEHHNFALASGIFVHNCTKLHPHPNSIYGTLVSMASKHNCAFPLFNTKGNFGSREHPASAERYTEAMISDLAIKIFESFADYVDMKLGELDTDEPEYLAALLPLCFLHGTYGIPSGMSTVNIPALNPNDMIDYYIEVLKSKNLDYIPDVLVKPQFGRVKIVSSVNDWKKILRTGKGSLKFKPWMEIVNNRTIVITSMPPGKTIDHVMKVLNLELQRDQIDIRDESTTSLRYVIEIPPYRRVNINDIYNKLDRGLTTSESYRFIFADKGIAVFTGFHGVVKENLKYLIECCQRKFENELKVLTNKFEILNTIELMKKDNNHTKLINMDTEQAVKFISETYRITEEQSRAVLSKSISYLTRGHFKELEDIKNQIEQLKNDSKDVYSYLLRMYESLKKDVAEFTKDFEYTQF
jgi:DNA gyrase/topoisomerase IV subunit A